MAMVTVTVISLGGVDRIARLVLDQAKALYRFWPDIEVGDRLFV